MRGLMIQALKCSRPQGHPRSSEELAVGVCSECVAERLHSFKTVGRTRLGCYIISSYGIFWVLIATYIASTF